MKMTELLVVTTTLLQGWSACPIFAGNREVKLPAASGDRNSPASIVEWELEAEEWDRENSTLDGSRCYRGHISFLVAVDVDGGQYVMAERIEDLEAIFIAADEPGVTFLAGDVGEMTELGTHAVRELKVPYLRFQEAA